MASAHSHEITGSRLRLAFVLTALILLVELVAGLASHSLALLSDAGHVLTDIVALGLAWFATAQAGRPADASRTYGYHRIGILAALVNAVTLIGIVVVILIEAIRRFEHPEPVIPGVMFIAAAIGIVVNLYIGFNLREGSEENLNLRAAMLHVFGDVGASAAVIVGGIIILLTRWYPADPLISVLIAALIAWSALGVLRDALGILMEAAPRGLNMPQMVRDMVRVPGVSDVHDLHVWSVAGGMHVLSAHVQVEDDLPLSECQPILDDMARMLRVKYNISHATIQFECQACEPNDLYCNLPGHEGVHDHVHEDHEHVHSGDER